MIPAPIDAYKRALRNISQDYYFYTIDKVLTSSQADSVNVKIDTESDFVWMALSGNRTGLYKAKITDTGPGRNLQFKQIQDTLFVGTAQQPNFLQHPHYFRRGSTVQIDLTDLSAAGNTIQMVAHGYRVFAPPPPSDVFSREIWYMYTTERQALTSNQKQEFTVQTDPDGDFVLQKIVADQTGAFQVQIYDTEVGKNWGSALANYQNVVGTGQKPFYLPKPRLIRRGSVIVVTLKDTSGSSNTIEVGLEGYKIFR